MAIGAFGLLGCVSFPSATLVLGQWDRVVVTGPVVCGPVGFRQVPLQSRWGEYVRVTVSAPSAVLRGNVLVHAGGVVQPERSWSTESTGALVVEARFPNDDPDRRFALERERPIDITLTGLEAPGGRCEGAVFTVEHGALVPSIDEPAWIAELERRGGPELAARRAAARLEADARRQAHSAAWEARQHLEVSADVIAQAEVIREAHYAQWDARHVARVAVGIESADGVAAAGNSGGAGSPMMNVASSGGIGVSGSVSTTNVAVSGSAMGSGSQLALAPTLGSSAGEWSQPSDLHLRAAASIESVWVQPFEPSLEPVAVNTVSRVATSEPVVVAACEGNCGSVVVEDPALVFVPAMFQLMFNVAATGAQPQVHAAQPIPPAQH